LFLTFAPKNFGSDQHRKQRHLLVEKIMN